MIFLNNFLINPMISLKNSLTKIMILLNKEQISSINCLFQLKAFILLALGRAGRNGDRQRANPGLGTTGSRGHDGMCVSLASIHSASTATSRRTNQVTPQC